MFEAINPLYWWGTAAVSVPIIIHLINRYRYRRVRWAAMEFLLKSQQRNRRKLIIEQLILLMLRCLLVLLAALLVIRPLWLLGGDAARRADLPGYHVVVLDDSLSMQDTVEPQGNAFRDGVKLILDLAERAGESSSTHYFTVLKVSDPKIPEIGKPFDQLAGLPPGQQVSSGEIGSLKSKLESLECTYLRLPLLPALQEANRYFANVKEGNKHLHIVSDFRRRDWIEGDADALYQFVGETAHPRGGNVQVRLHDTAQPRRDENLAEAPRGHANLGITDLVARFRSREEAAGTPTPQDAVPVRVVTPGIPVYLFATLRNFSEVQKSGLQLRVKVDGSERAEFSRDVKSIAAGAESVVQIPILFGSEEKLGLKQVAVYLDDSEKKDPLPADNVRYTYLELKKEIPVLLVDPTPTAYGGDSHFVARALTSNPRFGLKPVRIRPAEVKSRKDLTQFSVIYLLNVPGVGAGAAELDGEGLKALENYVRRGGSVVFFLGPRVNVASYNQHLYKNGQGIFPAPLMPRPNQDTTKSSLQFVDDPPDELDIAPKMRFLKADHPAFVTFQQRSDALYMMNVNRYFKVDPNWKAGGDAAVQAQVQNRRPLESYRENASRLVGDLNLDRSAAAAKLREYAQKIADAVKDAQLKRYRKGPLMEALTDLLANNELAEYWASPQRQALKQRIVQFQEVLATGDPLVLEAGGPSLGKGHVMAFLTSAGPTQVEGYDYEWNDWAHALLPGPQDLPFVPYVIMMLDVQSYMASLSRSATETPVNWLLGTPVDIRVSNERFDAKMQLWGQPENKDAMTKMADLTAQSEGTELTGRINPRLPGFYLLKLNQPSSDGGSPPKGEPEERPFAFNVDNRDEGHLSRLSGKEFQDQLASALSRPAKESQQVKLKLTPQESLAFAQGRPWFVTRSLESAAGRSDWSKSWADYVWVLALFFGILLIEQWLSVRLSYHLHGEAQLPAQGGRAKAA